MSSTFSFDCMPGEGLPIAVQASAATDNDDWFYEALTGGPAGMSESGVPVNAHTALSHGPVWQAVNVLAGDLGQLPFRKMRRRGRTTEKDTNSPLDMLMRGRPNDMQTPSEWKETMLSWALLWGNGISLIRRGPGPRGSILELLPLLPDRTGYTTEAGQLFIWSWIGEQYHLFRPDECFHVRGLATDGFWGRSAVDVARHVIGYGLGLRKHGNRTFKNGAVPRGVLKHPGRLSPDARRELRSEWNALHGGVDNAARIAILMEGADFSPTTINNVDAQWLEAVRLDREQVASLFNLPPHKLNALENAAVRANLEEQNRGYLQTSLSRWMGKFKEEAERKLLTDKEHRSGKHFFRWFPEAFLRSDTATRYDAYGKAIASRWLSPNEVRELEDLNPYEGGDEYLNPAIDTSEGSEEGSDPPTEEEGSDDETALAAQRAVAHLTDQAALLLQAEAKRVNRAASGESNFVSWLTDFYDGFAAYAAPYLQQPAAIVTHLGTPIDWEAWATAHAEYSRASLLEAADCTPSSLAERVAATCRHLREQPTFFGSQQDG